MSEMEPPKPPPPPDVRRPGNQPPLSFILRKDLILERKKLKQPNEIRKRVDVEREDVFDQYKKFDFVPLVDSREYLRTLRAEITSVNFSGVEQLTDAFLFSLYHCKLSLPSLLWISLAGCYNITDEGILYLCKGFDKMKTIQLMGCRKITEKSVDMLTAIPTMERIHVEGTNVGVVPNGWKPVLETGSIRNRKNEKKCVYINGCPIISPLKTPEEKTDSVDHRKVVIITTEDLPWSPCAILTNQKDTSPTKKLEVLMDWKPSKECKWTYNLFQVCKETGISELVLSPGSLVVLPYFLHPNKVGCLDSLILDLSLTISSVLTKYPDCTFHLLGMSYESEETDFTSKVTELYQGVQAKIQQWTERLITSLKLSIHTNWRMAALNFYEQQVLAFGERLSNVGKKCFKPTNGHCNILSSHIKVGKALTKTDLKFLDDIADTNLVQFPWIQQSFPKTLWDYSSNLAKKGVCKFQQLSDFCNTNMVDDLKDGLSYMRMEKLMSYSYQWGHALYYPFMDEKLLITDFTFLSSFTNSLLENSSPKSADIRCLGNQIQYWTKDDLKNACNGLPIDQLDMFLSLLVKLGIMMKFPADVWSGIPNVPYVYVLYKDFPEFPCEPITNYIPEGPINSWEKEKYYFCSPGLPQSFFPNLLRHAFKLGWPTVTWKHGAIIQKGFLVVLIELIYDVQGLPVIVLEVRCEKSNELHMTTFQTYTCIIDHLILKYRISSALQVYFVCYEKSNDLQMTTFQTYSCVIDYLILKNRISAVRIMENQINIMEKSWKYHGILLKKKSVPCVECTSKANRYELLSDKNTRRFFLEHLVRSGEQRDVRCKFCEAASIANVQLGKMVPITELVPLHELWGKALGTSNIFSQCLMCHNCATDGVECAVNLKEGNKNWQCECKRPGILCDYCGMCQRCCLYIKRIVSNICPRFEPPRMARYNKDEMEALDSVNVTEKGSFLGFIEEGSEIKLNNHILTPNYCPDLLITAIHIGQFYMKLELLQDKEMIEYDGRSGSLVQGGKSVLKEDQSRICRSGETVHVHLKYIRGGFTDMALCIYLNGSQIFCTEIEAQQVMVTFRNRDLMGMFLQVETPGKFRILQGDTYKRGRKDCGTAVAGFISAVEMKMWNMLNDIENIHFGGSGISLTGAAVVTLPRELTMDVLKYPARSKLKTSNYHFMCLTWNPFSGKKAAPASRKYSSRGSKEPQPEEEDKPQPKWHNQLTDYKTWKLRRQIHIVDSSGITQEEVRELVADTDLHFKTLISTWHFIYASYPEVLLPSSTTKLFPEGVLTPETERKVKAGLHENIKLGFWKYYSEVGLDQIKNFFPVFDRKTKRHFLTTRTPYVASVMRIMENQINIMEKSWKYHGILLKAAQEIVQKHLDKSGLNKTTSAFNSSVDLFLCDGHKNCLLNKGSVLEIKMDMFGTCGIFLSFINLNVNSLECLPEELFTELPNLIDIKLSMNYISNLPASIKHCKKLESIALNDNDLEDLPDELADLVNLTELCVSANKFVKLPNVIPKMKNLHSLNIASLLLPELPEDFGNLTKMSSLMLQGNCLSALPNTFCNMTEITEINISGVQWVKMNQSKVLSYDGFQHFLEGKKLDRWLDNNTEDRSEMFHLFDDNSNGVLEMEELGKLNAAMFNHFPRFGYKGNKPPDENTPSGFPMELLTFTKLRILTLTYQGFTKVPPEIGQLQNLTDLSLSHNPNLLSIPAELSTIKSLRKLDLEECPLLKTPPKEIREKGLQPTLAYLKRLMDGAVLSKRTKLMMVGLGGAGKTSLVKALLSEDGKAKLNQGEGITDGIDITTWQLNEGEDEITYNVWDFAGQTVYYNTHQFFLSTNRAIYFLLWNVRLGHEHAGLDFWLSSISVQAPKAPVFVIGSHIDQVNKTSLPIEEIQQRYPQIAGFHFISSYTGQGIKDLKRDLVDVTLQQQYMGEKIPAVWFTFENNIQKAREKQNIVAYQQIEYIANQSGIFEKFEIFQAVQFLHDLGSVQYFSNEYLKSKVVINPQWIVDVMACVVSVKTDVIDEGRLPHSQISRIWDRYPKNLHSWLLRLTEEFDLTFPLADKPANVVPCLLPEKRPKITWPDIERGSDVKETKMIYKFDYLPAGLFNRGQVRLYNLSDDSLMWKKGSFLKKNVHIALLQQVRDNELLVTVQGPRPDNILFLVHEVFEGLIAESFHGITYDFSLPCPQCQNMTVKDPHMFEASTIRRALDMKAPFLQCTKYFHTISCADLLTLLPPDSHSDFDAHLVQCVQGLKDLRKDLCAGIPNTLEHLANISKWYPALHVGAHVKRDTILKHLGVCCLPERKAGLHKHNKLHFHILMSQRYIIRREFLHCAIEDIQGPVGKRIQMILYLFSINPFPDDRISDLKDVADAKSNWLHEPGFSQATDDMAKALTEAPLFVAFVSNSYANDDECVNIFKYARLTLKKVILAVAIGDGFEWKQSKLGIFLADEVFVNMTKPKYDYYENKFEELLKTVSDRTKKVVDLHPSPSCFISYSWVNSAIAVSLGTKEVEGALGYGDPRELKAYLEEHGIQCWMDVERAGKNGLFTDIAEGLINAKVVVVCVSDEYAISPVCKLEFRYAANTLKKPLVMAVVGTGDNWRATEVGLLSVMYPIVNFQEKTKNAKKKLLKLVQKHLSTAEDPETAKESKDAANEQHKNLSYQELLELAQRKLIRQLALFAENQELKVYPRLFVVDFMEEHDDEEKGEKDSGVTEEGKGAEDTDLEIEEENPKLIQKRPVSRISSGIPPVFKTHRYCVYTLCEHDEGWHSVCEPLELPGDFGIEQLDMYVSYLSRITAIMKYNKKLILKCLTDDDGDQYLKWLDESTEEAQSDYQTVYHSFRELVMNLDRDSKMGNLMRCHLPNGKTIWLCQKHRDSMRVTCLSNEDQSTHHTSDQDTKVNNFMVNALRTMDYSMFDKPFTSDGNGPRKRMNIGKKRMFKEGKEANPAGKKGHQHQSRRRGQKSTADTIPENEADSESGGEDIPDTTVAVKQTTVKQTRNKQTKQTPDIQQQQPVPPQDIKSEVPATQDASGTAKGSNDTQAVTERKVKDTVITRPRDRRKQTEDTVSLTSTSSQISINQTTRSKPMEQTRRPIRGRPNQTSKACVLS